MHTHKPCLVSRHTNIKIIKIYFIKIITILKKVYLRENEKENGENYKMRIFVVCSLH